MRRASEQAGQQEGEQHRRTTDPAPDEETNKNRSDRGGAPRTGRGGQTGRLAECAEEGDARRTTAQGVVSWGHVKPTQRGKPKTTNARHSMV